MGQTIPIAIEETIDEGLYLRIDVFDPVDQWGVAMTSILSC